MVGYHPYLQAWTVGTGIGSETARILKYLEEDACRHLSLRLPSDPTKERRMRHLHTIGWRRRTGPRHPPARRRRLERWLCRRRPLTGHAGAAESGRRCPGRATRGVCGDRGGAGVGHGIGRFRRRRLLDRDRGSQSEGRSGGRLRGAATGHRCAGSHLGTDSPAGRRAAPQRLQEERMCPPLRTVRLPRAPRREARQPREDP